MTLAIPGVLAQAGGVDYAPYLMAGITAAIVIAMVALAVVALLAAVFLGALLVMGMLTLSMLTAFAQRSLLAGFRVLAYQILSGTGAVLGLVSGLLAWLITRPPEQGYVLPIVGALAGGVLAFGACWVGIAVLRHLARSDTNAYTGSEGGSINSPNCSK